MTPFITFYTPTYKRPHGLAACLASVSAQTAVSQIEQIIIADHVGRGIAGMYAQVPHYAEAVHGHYVYVLADDDVLAGPTVVEYLQTFAKAQGYPPLILVRVQKGGKEWPADPAWPPREGAIDLGCGVIRSDIWRRYANAYGHRYEGDADFYTALHQGCVPAIECRLLFAIGAVSHGAAEAA